LRTVRGVRVGLGREALRYRTPAASLHFVTSPLPA
jgi:hypothetical protein